MEFVPPKQNDSSVQDDRKIRFTPSWIFWLVFSMILAAILAKYSKGLCIYLFISFAWLFLWIMFAQAWNMDENTKEETAIAFFASIFGWFIGTFFVWKSRSLSTSVFN